MKALLFLILVFCVSLGANAQKLTTDYIALTVPQHYASEIWYLDKDTTVKWLFVDSVKHDKTLLKSFPNLVSNVTIYSVTLGGKLSVWGIGVSAKNSNYQVIYDFSQTQTIAWEDTIKTERYTIERFQSILVGVGVRMVAKVSTKTAGINLASPFSLAMDYEKIQGTLEVRVTGVTSPKINELIPTTSDLSPSSISNALQAVATIKSHLYDDDVIISPQFIAYYKRDSTITAPQTETKLNSQKK
jgi:hypothetical protein